MGTTVRPNISPSNKYWISKHRYYELKHFCLQYPEWKSALDAIGTESFRNHYIKIHKDDRRIGDSTAGLAIMRADIEAKIKQIENVAWEADPELQKYIVQAVTEGTSYDYMQANGGIPCCRDVFYDRYRKFFWLLNTVRG